MEVSKVLLKTWPIRISETPESVDATSFGSRWPQLTILALPKSLQILAVNARKESNDLEQFSLTPTTQCKFRLVFRCHSHALPNSTLFDYWEKLKQPVSQT